MSHLYCQCIECKPIGGSMEDGDLGAERLAEQAAKAMREKNDEERKHIYVLTQSFLALENFFADREKKVPKFPVGHAISVIKLQDEEIERIKKVLSHREMQLGVAIIEIDIFRDTLRLVSNAYGCFAGCTGNLKDAPEYGSGHTDVCKAARALAFAEANPAQGGEHEQP